MSAEILYKGETIRKVAAGQTATLLCRDTKLTDNITVKSNVKGNMEITENGTHDVSRFASVTVAVTPMIIGAAVTEWNAGNVYNPGDVVIYDDVCYMCIKTTQKDAVLSSPDITPEEWERINGEYKGEYDSTVTYSIGDIVTLDGSVYQANEDPPQSPPNNDMGNHWTVIHECVKPQPEEVPLFDGTINIESGFTTISGCYRIDQKKAYDALAALATSKTYAVEFSAGSFINGEQERKGFISMTFDLDYDSIIYGRADGSITAFSSGDYMSGGDGFAPYYNTYEEGNGAMVNFYEGTECRKEFKELFLSIADEYVG